MSSDPDATESAGTNGGYVHRPGDWDGDERVGTEDEGTGNTSDRLDDSGEDLGRTGWVLVAVVVLAFLVVPGIIYLRPATPGEFGLGFLTSMLVLPLVPAALLGATAVWSAIVNRGG